VLCDYNQCIDQLLQADDYPAAMKLILELPQNSALFSYVDRIPLAFIVKNPDFAYQCFFYYYVNIEFEKCKELYDALKLHMSEDSTFSAFRFSNMFVEDNFKINEISVMPVSEIEKLPLKETTKAFILIKDASFLYAQCRYNEALIFLDKAMNYTVSRNNYYIAFFIFSIKSQILEDMGELNKCMVLYKEMDKILASSEGFFMLNASFYIGITGVYLKQMDLKNTENSLKNVEEYISDIALSIDRGYKYNLAEYKFLIGETEKAMELVKELMDMESYNNPMYLAPLLKYVFKLDKFSGELVQRFIDGYESIEETRRSLDSKLLYAKILFNKGEVQFALELNDQILKYSRIHKIKLKLVQASLFKINMIYDNFGKKREIINLFREALFYSCEDKILHPYYFESEIVEKVIKQYASDFCNDLSSTEKVHYKEIINLCKIEIKPILSEREIDVMKEIAKGTSNKEIAEHLCISLATVKSHIINIYRKFQVNNRVAAVEAAKKYGIW
jgi:LuxR family transcriptional regulator, maltose regulon positive regulatory protein